MILGWKEKAKWRGAYVENVDCWNLFLNITGDWEYVWGWNWEWDWIEFVNDQQINGNFSFGEIPCKTGCTPS